MTIVTKWILVNTRVVNNYDIIFESKPNGSFLI